MAPKRRDNKGRILQMGEWQEPNGRYRYIYNDALGKRKIIYSWRHTEVDSVPAHRHKDVPGWTIPERNLPDKKRPEMY